MMMSWENLFFFFFNLNEEVVLEKVIFLGGVTPETDFKTRISVRVSYLRDDTRKHPEDVGVVSQARRESQ